MRARLFVAAVAAVLALPASTFATFPGRDGRIAYTRTDGFGNQTVWSVDPSTGRERQLTAVPEACRRVRAGWFDDVPAFSASGRRLFYSHSGDCGRRRAPEGIYRVSSRGGTGKLVLRDRRLRAPWWPVPTPGGGRLLFVNDLAISRRRDRDGYSDTIFSASLGRGARTRRLSPRGATTDEFAAVSASGRIAFARNKHRLLLGRLGAPLGDSLRTLTTSRRWDLSTPDFSPNGRRILFTRDRHRGRTFRSDVFVVGARGRGLRRLTRGKDAVSPVWSPSGRRIAYVLAPDDATPTRGPLYLAGPRGRNPRRLLSGVDHTRLSWQPLR